MLAPRRPVVLSANPLGERETDAKRMRLSFRRVRHFACPNGPDWHPAAQGSIPLRPWCSDLSSLAASAASTALRHLVAERHPAACTVDRQLVGERSLTAST